mmetsp:Transcript_44335/g.84785  ORF Transcript_44335/g.84785 Transcript_44335/m.84785 type:complete len:164 (+) Transcript_44335:169-660(+)
MRAQRFLWHLRSCEPCLSSPGKSVVARIPAHASISCGHSTAISHVDNLKLHPLSARNLSSSAEMSTAAVEPFWNAEWKKAQLKASQARDTDAIGRVLFIECGMGCDQHGQREEFGATKAAVRACRNAIEFNSIPCVQDIVPGGRQNMKIKLRLGVPEEVGGFV